MPDFSLFMFCMILQTKWCNLLKSSNHDDSERTSSRSRRHGHRVVTVVLMVAVLLQLLPGSEKHSASRAGMYCATRKPSTGRHSVCHMIAPCGWAWIAPHKNFTLAGMDRAIRQTCAGMDHATLQPCAGGHGLRHMTTPQGRA